MDSHTEEINALRIMVLSMEKKVRRLKSGYLTSIVLLIALVGWGFAGTEVTEYKGRFKLIDQYNHISGVLSTWGAEEESWRGHLLLADLTNRGDGTIAFNTKNALTLNAGADISPKLQLWGSKYPQVDISIDETGRGTIKLFDAKGRIVWSAP